MGCVCGGRDFFLEEGSHSQSASGATKHIPHISSVIDNQPKNMVLAFISFPNLSGNTLSLPMALVFSPWIYGSLLIPFLSSASLFGHLLLPSCAIHIRAVAATQDRTVA